MSSKVQICNLALTRLGAARITSLTDGTNEANLCNLLFDDTADEVMMEGPWTSTITRASLAKTSNSPAFGFTDEFQLPVSPFCLKVVEINEEVSGTYDYRVEGDKLLANISTMAIRYIGRVTDTQQYDSMLRRAIVSRLTAELAYPLTGQPRVAEAWFQKYERDVLNGLAIDGQQGSKQVTVSPDLTEIR